MKKLGKYGLYTAPALLAVLDAAQATVPISMRHPVMLTPNRTYGGVSKPNPEKSTLVIG